MAEKNYAILKDNIVINIIFIDDSNSELMSHFIDFYNADFLIEASLKAEINGTYDGNKFWKIKPYPSWIKNEELNEWEAPIPYPAFDEENPRYYEWNEELLNWEEIQVSE